MNKQLTKALELQRNAWNSGHENYGASIDIYAEALEVLKGFKASIVTTQGEIELPKFFPKKGPSGTYSQL